MSFNFSPKFNTDGLVLYLDPANTRSYISGSTSWNDISKQSLYNSTLVNGPTFNSSNLGSIGFDGVDDYGEFDFQSPLNNVSTFTISAWCYIPTLPATTAVIYGHYNTSINPRPAYFFGLVPGASNLIPRIYFGNTSNATYWTSNSESFLLNKWQQVVFTVNSLTAGVTCYVNGVNTGVTSTTVGSGAGTTIIPVSTIPWRFGRWVNNVGTAFYGAYTLGQFSIYNRSLSATEVLQNYNSTKTRYGI